MPLVVIVSLFSLSLSPMTVHAASNGNNGNNNNGNGHAPSTISVTAISDGVSYPLPATFACGVNPLHSPITISGSGTGEAPPGLISQYHVEVNWGDGTLEDDLGTFVPDSGHGTFTFTFNSAPHTYTTSGQQTITAMLYHQNPHGNDNQATSIPLTVCVDTGSAVNNPPIITLIGANPMTLTVGDTFTDPGATATDIEDGNLTSAIITTGTVNTNIAGTYTLIYTVTDSGGLTAFVTRSVIVNPAVPANTPPTITLIGTNPMTLTVGDTFTDPGATAIDTEDGDLTSSIIVSGTVNTSVSGVYTLTYSVTDSGGLTATTTRTVIVNPAVNNNTPPVITLNGSASMTVVLDSTFTDPGATATDAEDGNLTSSIVETGSVNTAFLGTFTLTYSVTDSGGLSASVVRTVTVVKGSSGGGNTAPTIALLGANPLIVTIHTTFIDPGATASDAEDGNLTSAIVETGTVDTNTLGTYLLTYTVTDSGGLSATATRVVIVNPQGGGGGNNNTPPVITLNGSASVAVTQGNTFNDLGATATDAEDGNLTSSIVETGSVDTNTVGTYTLTYSVTDSGGLTASVIRTVTVSSGGGGGGNTNHPPVITLIGSSSVHVILNHTFTDQGATATDAEDGNLTSSIVETGSVDTTHVGTYTLTYTVTDSGGLSDSVTRTVRVARSSGGGGGGTVGGSINDGIGGGGDTGEVLGASTDCGIYVDKFMRVGYTNDTGNVTKLQQFLNNYYKMSIPVTGIFDSQTEKAVEIFQVLHPDTVLSPWGITGSTGIVYLTTSTAINNIMCPTLNLSIPSPLINWSENPVTQKI